MNTSPRARSWGWAWLALSAALAFHAWDEAAHDFLSFYNPTVRAIREHVPFLPLPTFTFGAWLGGLIIAVVVLMLLSFFALRDARWLRPGAYAFAVLMIGNGLLHVISSAYYGQAIPGVYSSPLLIGAAIWLIIQLRQSASSSEATVGA